MEKKRMHKIIVIRQAQIIELAPKAKLIHGAVLDYIYWLCMNKSERVEYNRVNLKENEGTPNEKTYRLTWVSYPHLLEQMPLLRGRTVATLTPVFKCLEEWGFIKTAVWKGKGRKYVGLLEKTHILYKKHEDKEKEEEKQEEEEKEGEQGETV